MVFPTCVGVFLKSEITDLYHFGLPHVRGGVSFLNPAASNAMKSSPRAWGCFLCIGFKVCFTYVFPTCVGVFPRTRQSFKVMASLPHVRGGVSFT